jgi:hypothetical protein
MMWIPINQGFCLLLCFLASILVAQAEELTQCSSLNELNCIKDPACTLVQKGVIGYQCRGAVGKCEVDFIQWGETQSESCESKTGCKYVPGKCYCPPDVLCRCGGGKPPQCIEEY